MSASSWQPSGIGADGGANFVSSLGTIVAKAIANPFGVVIVAVTCSVITALAVGSMMSARQAALPPRHSAEVEKRTHDRRSPAIPADKGSAIKRPPAADQRAIVEELRRQNALLRGDNRNLRKEMAENNRRYRVLATEVAELKRQRAANENRAPVRNPLPTDYDKRDPTGVSGRTQQTEMARRRVPRSFSRGGVSSYGALPDTRYCNLSASGPYGVALREAVRRRQEAEARERHARRQAAVEVGRRHSRRSAFNRVYEQR